MILFFFCLGRAGSLPLLLLLRGRAEWGLPTCCGLSVPRFRLRCLSLILTARSTTWEFGGDFVVLPPRFILPCFSFSDRDAWEDKRAGSRRSSSWMSVVVALAPLPVRGHVGGGVDSSDRPLGSLLVFSRAGGGRGLLTAPARGVGALGLAVTGLDPGIDTGRVVTGGGRLTATGLVIGVRVFPCPLGGAA